MGLILDMSPRALEKILYFVSYVVLDGGDTPLVAKSLLTESEYRDGEPLSEQHGFRAGMGAEAVQEMLASLDLEALAKDSVLN